MKTILLTLLLFCFTFCPAQSGKIIKIDNFKSKYVKPRNVEIWLPAEYAANPKQQFPVLYMHDGQNVFNPKTAMGNVPWKAGDTAQRLIGKKEIQPVIIVAIWCTDARYYEYFPEKAAAYLTDEDRQQMDDAAAKMGVAKNEFLGDEYLKFMVEELKPFIDKSYRTLNDAPNTSVCGSSMGGLISFYAMCEYPDVFGQAACISTHWPILFDNKNMAPSNAVRGYFKEHLPSPANHRIYFDHGTTTLDEYYGVHQKVMDEIMAAAGYIPGKNWVTRKFEGAGHSEAFWQERFDVALKFLYPNNL